MKKCSRCKADKDDLQFIHGKTKCLACYHYLREYYQKNREREIERAKRNTNKDRNHTNMVKRKCIRKNPISYMLWQVKARAKKYKIPFNLTHDDINIPDVCPILGIKLQINDGCASGCSPSIDRINPNLGYIKGNVAIISYRANTIKSNATAGELKKVLDYVIDHQHETL
jgi:hypothetical protein